MFIDRTTINITLHKHTIVAVMILKKLQKNKRSSINIICKKQVF